jgi:hypothetical protein
MPISWRIGPLTTAMLVIEVVLLDLAVDPLAASARITGKYSGRAPAITAFTATFSVFPELAGRGRPHPAHDLIRGVACALQHRRDTRFGRQGYRQAVGPMVLQKQLVQILLAVGAQQSGGRTVERQAGQILCVERSG